jgi:predicted outer membrane repeat protein
MLGWRISHAAMMRNAITSHLHAAVEKIMKRNRNKNRPFDKKTHGRRGLMALPAVAESLEVRRLLSNLPLDQNVLGNLNSFGTEVYQVFNTAQGLETELNSALNHPLPIIGNALGSAVTNVESPLNTLFTDVSNAFSMSASDGITAMEQALNTDLGPAGTVAHLFDFPLVNGSYQFPQSTDEIDTPSPSDNTVADRVELVLPLKISPEQIDIPLSFSTGLPGLGLNASQGSNVDLSLGVTGTLAFGYDGTFGFFVDTAKTTLGLSATLTLSSGTNVSGTLGFLLFTATDHQGSDGFSTLAATPYNGTSFNAGLNVTLEDNDSNSSLPTGLVPLSDIGSVGASADLQGTAQVNLDMTLGFTGLGQADLDLPSLQTLFHMDWTFGSSNGSLSMDNSNSMSQFGDAPNVDFVNVSLNAGDLFNNYIGPVLNDIDSAIQPFIDVANFLNKDVPVLNFLFPGDSTIADVIDDLSGADVSQFASIIGSLGSLINDVPTSVSGLIPLGSLDLDAVGGNGSVSSGTDPRNLTDGLSNLNLSQVDAAGRTIDQIEQSLSGISSTAGDFLNNVANATGGTLDDLGDDAGDDSGGGATVGNNGQLDFPILDDPASAFGLLMGKTVNLFTFTVPTLKVGFSYSNFIPIFPGIGITIAGDIPTGIGGALDIFQLTASLSGGYDSTGLQALITDGFSNTNTVANDLLDGLYLNTGAASGLSVSAGVSISATVEVPLVVAFSAGGGISGTLSAYLSNNGQSEIHWSQLLQDAGGNIADLFSIAGEIDLNAFVSAQLFPPFGPSYTFPFANAVLYTFNGSTNANGVGNGFGVQTFTTLSASSNSVAVNQGVVYTAQVTTGNRYDPNDGMYDGIPYKGVAIGEVEFKVTDVDQNPLGSLGGTYAGTRSYVVDVPLTGGTAQLDLPYAYIGAVSVTALFVDPATLTENAATNGPLFANSTGGPVSTNIYGTIYVDQSAPASGTVAFGLQANTGISWPSAFTTLGAALDSATPGCTILVAEGEYFPAATGDSSFNIDQVTVIGGFAPGGGSGNQPPDPSLYPTILNGDLNSGHSVVVMNGGLIPDPESYTVSTYGIYGCTIEDGHATDGGAISISGFETAVVENCIFQNNSAQSGGAIYVNETNNETAVGSYSIVDCLFDNNSATQGSAIYIIGDAVYPDPSITNCTITDNTASSGGEAVYIVYPFAAGSDAGAASNYVALINCILWNDTGGEVSLNGYEQLYDCDVDQPGLPAQIQYVPLETGDKDLNPNFVGTGTYPYELQFPSPCVNTGNIAAIGGLTTDLANNPRVLSNIKSVDMGAYENQGPAFTLYVDQQLTHGNNNGSSWANAFQGDLGLQNALALAGPGDTIDVAEGIYIPGNSATSTFQLIDNVTIQGGFISGGASAPNPTLYPTYLNGGGMNYHVVTGSGTNDTAILDGFTIEGGNADGSGENSNGAGVYNNDGSPTIESCTFVNNDAAGAGGAASNENAASPLFANCLFYDNSAAYFGGAIYNWNADSSSVPNLLNCAFYSNTAPDGGAIYDNGGASYALNCSFTQNTASNGEGGAIYVSGTTTTLTNCILWNDTASGDPSGSYEIYFFSWSGGGVSATSCDIEGGGFSGTGNINSNPLFASGSDLQLQDGSPAIQSGDYAAGLSAEQKTGIETDLGGNPRLRSISRGGGGGNSERTAVVDMGAYSYEGPINLTFNTSSPPPNIVAAASPFTTVVALLQNGQITVGDNSTVTLSIASGPARATLNGSASLQTTVTDGYIATFSNVEIDGPSGVYTLEATDGGDIAATSNSITVSAGGTNVALSFAQQPNAEGVTVGTAMSPAVQVDVFAGGTLYTNDHSAVTLTLMPSGTVVGVVDDNDGVAYFANLIFNTPGTYHLVATDSTYGSIESDSFPVYPAPIPTTLAFNSSAVTVTEGTVVTPAITVTEMQNGSTLTSDNSSTVTLSLTNNTSGGTVSGALSAPVINGVATFNNLSFSSPGAYELTATDGGDVPFSLPVNVVAPTFLVFTTEPSSGAITLGQGLPTFAVSVEQNGQVVTSDNSIVRVTVLTPVDASYGPEINVQAVNGVATFSNYGIGSLLEDYNIILQASDLTNPGDIGSDSTSFSLTPLPPQSLTATTGATATAGSSISPGISFELDDSIDDVLPLDSSSVTASIYSGPAGAVLSGNLTEPMNIGFSNLILNLAGSYMLQFTDSADNVTAYSNVTINPQTVPTQLAFIQQPSLSTDGNVIEPRVTVAAEDQYGNIVTSDDSDQVTLSIASLAGDTLNGEITETVQDGVATFSDIYMNDAGTYSLGAASGYLASAVSDPFTVVAPQTIYVDQNANGANNGQDWFDAYTSLQSALSTAISGDTIDVAQGDYSPGNSVTDTFQLLDGVTIQGGFATGGLAGPNPAQFTTTLDGMSTNYNVVTGNGTDSSAILEGFTITGGNASGDGIDYIPNDDTYFGGGLIADGGSPTISDCIFTNNTALGGGAVYAANGATPELINCTFSNNSTTGTTNYGIGGGGAILDVTASPNIVDCQFLDNTGDAAVNAGTGLDFIYGGAIANFSSAATITNCLFTGNTVPYHQGGAIYDNDSSTTLTNCTFSLNSEGVYEDLGSNPTFTNSIFWNDGSEGDEIAWATFGTPSVSNCDVEGGVDDSSYGGGYVGDSNINVDPQFVDPAIGDFELQPTSPCINVGQTNAPALAGLNSDLAGNPRIVDSVVDMGAYEAQTVDVSWTGAGDGINWSDPANWSDDLVPTPSDEVTIGAGFTGIQIGAGSYAVGNLVSSSPLEITSGSPEFDALTDFGSATLTVDGGATLQFGAGSFVGNIVDNGLVIVDGSSANPAFDANISGNGGVTLDGPGTVTFTGDNTYLGQTTIGNGATLYDYNTSSLPTGNNITNNGELVIAAGTSVTPIVVGAITGSGILQVEDDYHLQLALNSGLSTIGSISIAANGTLDIANNELVVDYAATSPQSMIQSYIADSMLVSSFVTANPGYGIGYADGTDGAVGGLSTGQFLIEPALDGDADLNGIVNIHDLQNLLSDFNQPGSWDEGNFTGHARVDISDLQALLSNFNQSSSSSFSDSSSISSPVFVPSAEVSSATFTPEIASGTETVEPAVNPVSVTATAPLTPALNVEASLNTGVASTTTASLQSDPAVPVTTSTAKRPSPTPSLAINKLAVIPYTLSRTGPFFSETPITESWLQSQASVLDVNASNPLAE